VITGGASGIGLATAARFIQEGSRVCVFDRDLAGGQQLLETLPGLTSFIPCDVSRLDQIQPAFDRAVGLMGGVDVLVNNAGISIRHASVLEITPDEWDRVIATNLTGHFFVAQAAARLMVAQGGGVILNMASTNGIMGFRYYADYNATKAGLVALTKSLALEWAPRVRVNAVCPGYVLTPMQEAEYTPEMLAEVNGRIPLGRHATPEELAGLFAYLASDEAAYFTGSVIVMDGGETAGSVISGPGGPGGPEA
jgi:NAD(P)-dependent dehydrogenase (short-subunit alcohol dehydrogenase family)